MADWTLAECTKVEAFDFMRKLIIVADGDKPTPCHIVKISPSPLLIYPPQFLVQWEQPKPCQEVITPYHVTSEPYPWPDGGKLVKVACLQEGKPVVLDVEVKIVKSAVTRGGGDIPTPFAIARTETAMPVPQSDTATGYSSAFSFEEAFQNAIDRLPKRPPSHPDELVRIEVKKIGAELGGFVGFHHLFVEVERTSF